MCITGILAGLLGGLLGIGGSSIMLPAMVLILGSRDTAGKEQIHQYMAAAMIVNFLLIIPAVTAHIKNKAVWPKVWGFLSVAALVGVIIGVQVSFLFTGKAAMYLRWSVGLFFIYVVFHNIWRIFNGRELEGLPKQNVEASSVWPKFIVGLPMGIVAGLLGIGGGSLAVPAQQIILKMPLRNAIATSAATIASISWLGAILKNGQLGENGTITRSLILAGCLAPTAMIGSYVGGHLTHKLPIKIVRAAFIILMLFSAWKMFSG